MHELSRGVQDARQLDAGALENGPGDLGSPVRQREAEQRAPGGAVVVRRPAAGEIGQTEQTAATDRYACCARLPGRRRVGLAPSGAHRRRCSPSPPAPSGRAPRGPCRRGGHAGRPPRSVETLTTPAVPRFTTATPARRRPRPGSRTAGRRRQESAACRAADRWPRRPRG